MEGKDYLAIILVIVGICIAGYGISLLFSSIGNITTVSFNFVSVAWLVFGGLVIGIGIVVWKL